jgi:hypothetical protein
MDPTSTTSQTNPAAASSGGIGVPMLAPRAERMRIGNQRGGVYMVTDVFDTSFTSADAIVAQVESIETALNSFHTWKPNLEQV